MEYLDLDSAYLDTPREPLNQTYNLVDFETVGECPNCGERVYDSIGGRQDSCKCGQKLCWR